MHSLIYQYFSNFVFVLSASHTLDKAGGKRFSKDFEDGSAKLQEFVSFLDGEVIKGPPLMEALENADIFYEMQYKEVKVVAKVSIVMIFLGVIWNDITNIH